MIEIVFVWLLNIAVIAMMVLALLNWPVFSWIVGSEGLGLMFEMLFIISNFYVIAAGSLLLAWPDHLRSSYFALRKSSSCRIFATQIFPILLASLFTIAFCMLTIRNSHTNNGLEKTVSSLMKQYDKNNDGKLTYQEYTAVMLSLYPPPGEKLTNEEYRHKIVSIFPDADYDQDGFLTSSETLDALVLLFEPALNRLAISFLVLAIIIVVFVIFYAIQYRSHKQREGGGIDTEAEALLPEAAQSDMDKHT